MTGRRRWHGPRPGEVWMDFMGNLVYLVVGVSGREGDRQTRVVILMPECGQGQVREWEEDDLDEDRRVV